MTARKRRCLTILTASSTDISPSAEELVTVLSMLAREESKLIDCASLLILLMIIATLRLSRYLLIFRSTLTLRGPPLALMKPAMSYGYSWLESGSSLSAPAVNILLLSSLYSISSSFVIERYLSMLPKRNWAMLASIRFATA